MEKGKVRGIPYFKCGPPRGPLVNRPSIEYSGFGDTLCFECWGGRYFRSDPEAVEEQVEMFVRKYRDDKETVNLESIGTTKRLLILMIFMDYLILNSQQWVEVMGILQTQTIIRILILSLNLQNLIVKSYAKWENRYS